MVRRQGFQYRLKTTPTLRRQFARTAGACRFVWNKVLATNEGRYLAGVPRLTLQTEREVEASVHPSQTVVGIDLGIATFAATSDGELHPPRNAYRTMQAKLAKAHRRAARKVKFSQNWQKCQAAIRRLHTNIARCRHDFLHKLSTTISKNHAVIVVEDLQVSNMSRSAKGTVDEPGTNVAAKSGLNKAILDQGWGMFRQMLDYKQQWRGGELLAVNPRYTSQTCPQCGHVSKLNRPQQALFSCVACGYTYHADIVAAINILALGQGERLNAFAHPLGVPGIPVL